MSQATDSLFLAPGSQQKEEASTNFGDGRLDPWQWPIVRVSGASDGPKVCVTAGMHAAEYPGMEAAMRFAASVDPQAIRGSLVILPVINVPGLWQHTFFVCPVDGKDIHSSFPGSSNGSFTDILAFHVFEQLIRHSDYYIDMHGGDLIEDLTPFAQYWQTGNERVDAVSKEMAFHHAMPLVLENFREGSGAGHLGSAYATASWAGIPSMMAEAGSLGTLNEDAVSLHYRGLTNVLRYLGILSGDLQKMAARPIKYIARIRSEHKAMFVCNVQPGDVVHRSQVIGHYHDLWGHEISSIEAPTDGIVLWRRSGPPVEPGANLAAIFRYVDE
jgi:uncharacterized protein